MTITPGSAEETFRMANQLTSIFTPGSRDEDMIKNLIASY